MRTHSSRRKRQALCLSLMLALLLSLLPVAAVADSEAAPSDWAAAEIESGIASGLIPAALQTEYQKPVSRGKVAQLLVNMLEQASGQDVAALITAKGPPVQSDIFTDTADEAVLAANALGIIHGTSESTFSPDETLTRAQMAAIISRTATVLDYRVSGYPAISFADTQDHWVKDELAFSVAAGIFKGTGENRFEPETALTVEQLNVVAMRTVKYMTEHPPQSPADETRLTMGTNAFFPPYEFYRDDQLVGIDIDIAKAIAKTLDMELVIVDMEFDALLVAVINGEVDIAMAALTVTESRVEHMSFSDPYAENAQVVIVPKGSAIQKTDDLFIDGASHKVGVKQATTAALYALWDIEDSKFGTVEQYTSDADVMQAVKTGKVDCAIMERSAAEALLKSHNGLVILEDAYSLEHYAIAIGKENTALLEKINTALRALIADGTVQRIIESYS